MPVSEVFPVPGNEAIFPEIPAIDRLYLVPVDLQYIVLVNLNTRPHDLVS